MNYLIDTCTLVWLFDDPDKLTPKAKAIVTNNDYRLFVSVISLWEIQLKRQKFHYFGGSHKDITDYLQANEISVLPVTSDDVEILENLQKYHHDPFDHMIICQAKNHYMSIITCDQAIAKYNVNVIW